MVKKKKTLRFSAFISVPILKGTVAKSGLLKRIADFD